MAAQTYAIRGGQTGRERLRVLSHVLQAGTFDFLDRVVFAREWCASMWGVVAVTLRVNSPGV